MQAGHRSKTAPQAESRAWYASTKLLREGMLAGCAGGATMALWFFILDMLAGHPFYTPSVLGTSLFQGPGGFATPVPHTVSIPMVVAFSCVHWLIFAAVGGIASWLLTCAEYNRYLGFGLLFLFLLIVFELGFLIASTMFSEVLRTALDWKTVYPGNLLAAIAMGLYLWYRHPLLQVKDVSDTFFSQQ
jgi:hypothetical protein